MRQEGKRAPPGRRCAERRPFARRVATNLPPTLLPISAVNRGSCGQWRSTDTTRLTRLLPLVSGTNCCWRPRQWRPRHGALGMASSAGPLLAQMVRAGSAQVGARHGLDVAEEFRLVRFGGLQPLLGSLGKRL